MQSTKDDLDDLLNEMDSIMNVPKPAPKQTQPQQNMYVLTQMT
jgi:hypothetical protein